MRMNRLMRAARVLAFASLMFVLDSCMERLEPTPFPFEGSGIIAETSDPEPFTPTSIPIDVIASSDESDSAPVTKTTLTDGSVLWTSGDSFSMLGIGSETVTAQKPAVSPLSLADLNGMTVNQTKTVMIASVSSSAYKISSSGTAFSGVKNSGYTNQGTGITDAQATDNEAKFISELETILNGSDARKYQFIITRTSSGFTIKNLDNYYWAYSSGLKLQSSSPATFTFETPTNSSSSTLFVKQNTGSTVVNPNILRISTNVKTSTFGSATTYYLYSNGTTPTLSTSTGGWTYFYVCEVAEGGTEDKTYKTAFNNEFTITDASTGSFSGEILKGSTTNIAVYPYSEDHTFDGTTVTISIPKVQHYAANSFGQEASPMISWLTENNHLSFKNLCGSTKLGIKGTTTVYSIDITDHDESLSLWGKATISASDIINGKPENAKFSGGTNTVTLDCGAGVKLNASTATNFYIVLPAGAFAKGFTATLHTSDGDLALDSTRDNTVKRSVVKAFSSLTQSSFTPVIELDTFDIMNPLLHQYFDNVNYSSSQLASGKSLFTITSTQISGAVDSGYRPDQPAKYEVTWKTGASGTATVALYKDAACTQLFYDDQVSVSAGKYSFSDMVPGREYYYKVTNGSTVLAKGGFRTEGQVRMITVEGSYNARDIGGWTGLGGHKIQYEMVYRGCHLDNPTDHDKRRLQFLNITGDTDFRPIDKDVEATIFNREDHSNCLAATNLQSNGNGVMFFHKCTDNESQNIMYTNTSTDPKKADRGAYVMHMAFLIDAVLSGHPTYFHCKSGADRTGVFGLLVEGLLGVDPGDIIKDYEITSFSQENGKNGNSRTFSSTANIGKAYNAVMNNSMKAPASYDTFQKRCYYYFNNCFDKKIRAKDLDDFIMTMLDMTPQEYAKYRPSDVYDDTSSSYSLGSVYYWNCDHDHGWN